MLDKFRKQVEVFGFYRHLDFCPHSSSVIEIAFAISMTASPREKRLRRYRARSFLTRSKVPPDMAAPFFAELQKRKQNVNIYLV